MNVAHLLHHVPTIERQLKQLDLDALVIGLGPSGWLTPWLRSRLLLNIELWGAHDVDKIIPVDHLLLMDSPGTSKRLLVGTAGYEQIQKSRPYSMWVYEPWWEEWKSHLSPAVMDVAKPQKFFVWGQDHRNRANGFKQPAQWMVGGEAPHCGGMSPWACITKAWETGCRRIGVLGVDLGPEHPQTHQHRKQHDSIGCHLSSSAHQQGGLVVNLSPISWLKKWRAWTPPEEKQDA